jgi:repressor LexA
MRIKSDIGYLMQSARIKAGLSQEQTIIKLSTLGIELSRSAMSKYETSVNSPSIELINALSKIYGTDPMIFLSDDYSSTIHVMTNKIPVYGRIPAGIPFEAIQDLLEEVEIPSWLAEKKGLFGLKVVGDSMNKVLPDGSIAVLQKTDTLNNGEIGAILVNGFDATLKKFYQLTDSIVLEPLSYNPDNKTLIYTDETEIRPIGKLVWFCAAQSW